jgi:hypothetical protein
MNRLILIIDELLEAYERVTPSIDQKLVDRVLAEKEEALKHYATLRRCFLGLARAAVVLLTLTSAAFAWDTRENPDRLPSIGWGLHGGRLAGIVDDDARYTEFGADVRVPVNNYLTLTVDFAQTTVSNAPNGVSTEANRYGAGVRVYLADLFSK